MKVNRFNCLGLTIQSNKRGEEDSAGRVEWVETNVGGVCDRRRAARVKQGLLDGSERLWH